MNDIGKIVAGVLIGTLIMGTACIAIEKGLNSKKKKKKMKPIPEFMGNVVDISIARKMKKK